MKQSWSQLSLLFFLLLFYAPAVAASPQFSSLQSDYPALLLQALRALVSGPLRGHNLLLVTDDHSQRLLDVGPVVAVAAASFTPVFLATKHSLLHTARPAHHTKGSLLTAVILFHHDPTAFLLLLADNRHWNPNYLVLFCLNQHLNTTSLLAQTVVQRSQFILLLQPAVKAGQLRLNAYTSLPTQHSAQGRPLTKAPLGVWTPQRFSKRLSLFPPRFLDFGGKVFRVGTICTDNPFVYKKNGKCVGMNLDTLRIIGDKLNFSHILIERDIIIWGIKVKGKWEGLIGALLTGESDMAINSLIITHDRTSSFDFTYPYFEFGYGVLAGVPPPVPRWKNVVYPFSTRMWILVLVTAMVSCTVLAVLLYQFHYITDLLGYSLQMCSVLLNQPMPGEVVSAWWARVWLVVWWVAVDILAAAYMSNLMSVLTVPVYPYRIQTVDELAASDKIPVMPDYGSMVPETMRSSDNPSLATLGHRMEMDYHLNLSDPFAMVTPKVLTGKYVMVAHVYIMAYTQAQKDLTQSTYIMKENIFKSYLVWWMPPNTPYTKLISDYLTRLLESGILAKMYDNNLMQRYFVIPDEIRGAVVLSLDHLQSAFIILLVGASVGAATLMLEQLV